MLRIVLLASLFVNTALESGCIATYESIMGQIVANAVLIAYCPCNRNLETSAIYADRNELYAAMKACSVIIYIGSSPSGFYGCSIIDKRLKNKELVELIDEAQERLYTLMRTRLLLGDH
jgi:hypothetical protein